MSIIDKILKKEDITNYECKSRMEKCLKALVTGKGIDEVKPITSFEKVLKAIAEGDVNKGMPKGTAVPVEDGTLIPTVYFNTSLSTSEVNTIINSIDKGQMSAKRDDISKKTAWNFTVIDGVNPDTNDDNFLTVYMNEEGGIAIIHTPWNGSSSETYYIYANEKMQTIEDFLLDGLWVGSMKNSTFVGWNNELLSSDEYTINAKVNLRSSHSDPVLELNEAISGIVSITPFE